MGKRIFLIRYSLLVLSLLLAAGSMVWHRGNDPYLRRGDPTQLTRPSLSKAAMVPVEVITPQGKKWQYVDFSEGKSLAEFLNNMGEELFGKAAYAAGAPQMLEGSTTRATMGVSVGRHRGLIEKPQARVPNMVHLVARHADGTVFYDKTFHNLRTNAGINWQYGQMAGGTAAVCTYIALSNDAGSPNATDTAVASEITSNGLARALGTASHTTNATSYTLAYTFTATGTQSAQKAGILNATSSGTLCFENTFTQVSMVSGDTLAVTWTINF